MNYQVFVTVKGEEREESYEISASTLVDAQKRAQKNLDFLKESFPSIFINHEILTVVEEKV
tara:strand:- start:1859 stop:2041 length:183 start_codon:yes stop_codon:yes gene_type:complete